MQRDWLLKARRFAVTSNFDDLQITIFVREHVAKHLRNTAILTQDPLMKQRKNSLQPLAPSARLDETTTSLVSNLSGGKRAATRGATATNSIVTTSQTDLLPSALAAGGPRHDYRWNACL